MITVGTETFKPQNPDALELALDVSDYQVLMDYALLAKAGIKAIWAKLGQGRYIQKLSDVHIHGTHDAGMLALGYDWYDPYVSPQEHIDTIGPIVEGRPLKAISVDLEQYGWTYKNLEPIVDPAKLSTGSRLLCEGIESAFDLMVIPYTTTNFIVERLRNYEWLEDYFLWIASYPFHPDKTISTSWEYFIENFVPNGFFPYLNKQFPPNLIDNIIAWQFTGDRFLLPGVWSRINKSLRSALDVNLVKQWFLQLLGAIVTEPTEPPEPPVPPEEPSPITVTAALAKVVSPRGLYCRRAPTTSAGAWFLMPFGRKVEILESKVVGPNIWGRIGVDQWAAEFYNGNTYLERMKLTGEG